MIILDHPIVTELVAETLYQLNTPIVKLNDVYIPHEEKLNVMNEEDFFNLLRTPFPPLFSYTESGLGLV